ncbi:DUF262 domain-containing protein [Methylomonas sp. MV1]|uniref:DUF262 domain-containing protein n=1 Tax=Methylomonas sp. MV1 TaxID=3073620 RepID=UPI0028A3DF41|nr:DUF262 domain-containing protein [Methylomonas sp. MV1]MDT4332929.1 DUF262 domain-containing protein [Methylomonas sp. MV1]
MQDDRDDQNYIQEDESGLEKEGEEFPDIEVPFDPSKIDIQVKTISISTLQSRLKNDELDLTPDFQRQANVWDVKRKSRLIESVLLRIPLPSFYLSEDEDGVYAVVDGLQRLCTLFHFMDYAELNRVTEAKLDPLRLNDLQYLKELNKSSFAELDRKFQRRISELEITANIIRASTPPAVKFNVFARLNQGGMPLNAQEIRNAIYPGNWRKKLQVLAKSQTFLNVTERKIKTQRQQDLELVLRFVALWQLGKPFQRPLNQTLDDFLNDTVEKVLRHWDDARWSFATQAFDRALKAAQSIFGKHVFRKSVNSYTRTPINRGLFEAQLIALSAQSDENILRLTEQQVLVKSKLQHGLKPGSSLASSLLYATGSADASNTRIKEMSNILQEVLDA